MYKGDYTAIRQALQAGFSHASHLFLDLETKRERQKKPAGRTGWLEGRDYFFLEVPKMPWMPPRMPRVMERVTSRVAVEMAVFWIRPITESFLRAR